MFIFKEIDMAIEVGGVSKVQPLASNSNGFQAFDANGKATSIDAKVNVKRVEEVDVGVKVKETKTSEKEVTTKPLENDEANKEMIQKMLDDINSSMYSYNKELHFSVNETTKDLVIKVVNGKTGEVIQQYPAEEIVGMREKLLEGKTAGLGIESKAN